MARMFLMLWCVLAAALVQGSTRENVLDDETSFLQVRQRTKRMKVKNMVPGLGVPPGLMQVGLQTNRTKVKRVVAGLGPAPALHDYNSDVSDDAVWPCPDDPDNAVTEDDRQAVRSLREGIASHDIQKLNASVKSMAMIQTDYLVQEGAYDLIFQVLKEYQADEYASVQQNAWRGLSDQTCTEKGSYIIANMGGPNEGVRYMVEQLLVHPLNYGTLADHLDVQYEIMCDLTGLIIMDNNNTRGQVAVESGVVTGVMRALMGEPDSIATIATACKLMSALFVRNPSGEFAKYFKDAGADIFVNQALERFKDGDDTPFHFGFTMGSWYNVTASCAIPAGTWLVEDWKENLVAGYRDWKPWVNLNFPL